MLIHTLIFISMLLLAISFFTYLECDDKTSKITFISSISLLLVTALLKEHLFLEEMKYILIYSIGMFLAYISPRYYVRKIKKEIWTIGERNLALILSLFSWASFIVFWFIYLLYRVDKNKPSNW